MSFYGEFEHSIDNKGRLIVPSRLRSPIRDYFIEKFFITPGFDEARCLYLFPPEEWQKIEKKFLSLPINKSRNRAVHRLFFSGAFVADCDKQGRILIPKKLLEYGEIEKDVMIVGVSSRLEVWALAKWKIYMDQVKTDYADMAENLENFLAD